MPMEEWARFALLPGAVGGVFCARVAAAYVGLVPSARAIDGTLMALALKQALACPQGPAAPAPGCGVQAARGSASSRALSGYAVWAVPGAAVWLPFALQPGLPAAVRSFACLVLLVLGLIDARCRLLPDALTLPLMWAGLLLAWAGVGASLHDAVIGAVLGYALFRVVDAPFRCLRGRPGVGGGDMKLAAALGAWFGWQPLPFVLLSACLAGILFAFVSRGRRALAARVALGPFLSGTGACGLAVWPVVQLAFCPGVALCTRWVLPAG